jgi:hypothetical protein
MSKLRFNHMELTLPKGVLERDREAIRAFYCDVFGLDALDVPILKQTGLLLRTDPETSQFLLVTEQTKHMSSPGYDHLGFLLEERREVDALLDECRRWQAKDSRVEIKEYEDLVVSGTTTHAFYVRYLLPIWFDVQTIEFAADAKPTQRWTYR